MDLLNLTHVLNHHPYRLLYMLNVMLIAMRAINCETSCPAF
jgi:hypothetical protein